MSFDPITSLRVSLASPEQIRRWSSGEVITAETINYRTQQPEPDGLFCERIFGPIRDWSCACGKYRGKQTTKTTCEKCGVDLVPASVRRERMGHIELATPVVHPWYVRDHTIGVLLGLTARQLATVLSYQRSLVLWVNEDERTKALAQQQTAHRDDADAYARLARLQPGDLLEYEHTHTLSLLFPVVFHARTGAEALRERLTMLDLDQLAEDLRSEIATAHHTQKQAMRRLSVVEAFRSSGQQPAWMVFSVLPVLPPELRPILLLDGGRIASSDLNELYGRVLHRNTRLKRFLDEGAPEIILNHERRLLQQACDALFDNTHTKKPLTNARNQPLKSLTALLQGKHGRFRRNLLGKRVDYSGRSVIVAGPQLLLHECGLPKEMACELFKPFLMGKLLDRRYAYSPRAAKRMVERRDEIIWDLLDEILFERVVLLNRAPTLHRLSIQAFQPRLIEGNALHLHPLVCSAFNADFDGDQMAVHVPLSAPAQEEAHRLLLSTQNLRHPASGEPAIAPSQEIVLGCFYLTEDRPSAKQARRLFTDAQEAFLAYAGGHLEVQTPLVVRLSCAQVYDAPPPAEPHIPQRQRIETTVGRLLFNEILPEPLGYRNYPMTKTCLKALVAECLTTSGKEATVQLLDAMKRLGYQYATKSGISLSLFDITMPPEREELLQRGHQRVQETEERHRAGELTDEERYRQVIAIWTDITEIMSETLKNVLDPYGTMMTIVKSGATKAQFQQIRQLGGMRGLMASPSGKILPIPVRSNYLLGLLVWELFIAASGARKGFMDRSLNTAMSGYLTRRLVEAGMEVIITQDDCHTTEGLVFTQDESAHKSLPSLRNQLIGRVLVEDLEEVKAGTLLHEALVDRLLARGVKSVRVRSVLSCQAFYGVCRKCYGVDLATGTLVTIGAAVGVLAGQSIGEPGTQLTMRTFHAGGIAHNAADITLGLPRVNELFEMRTPSHPALLAHNRGIVQAIETDEHAREYHIRMSTTSPEKAEEWSDTIPVGRTLAVQVGQSIEVGMPLAEGPLDPQEIMHLLGQEAAQRTLINEVQRVYRATGAVIHDKHLEVIVRQMSRYVQIIDSGDTNLLPGEIIDRFVYLQCTLALLAQGGAPARARPLLLGLTRTVLQTSSWIAAASFQEMSHVLARAALHRQEDHLRGLKEALVLGKKLPRTWVYE